MAIYDIVAHSSSNIPIDYNFCDESMKYSVLYMKNRPHSIKVAGVHNPARALLYGFAFVSTPYFTGDQWTCGPLPLSPNPNPNPTLNVSVVQPAI